MSRVVQGARPDLSYVVGRRAAVLPNPLDRRELACPPHVMADRILPARVAPQVVAAPDDDGLPVAEDVDVSAVDEAFA